MSTQETTLLSREAMDRIAQSLDVTITMTTKKNIHCLHVRDHGVVLYLGYERVLERLSEDAFTAKVKARLEKSLKE